MSASTLSVECNGPVADLLTGSGLFESHPSTRNNSRQLTEPLDQSCLLSFDAKPRSEQPASLGCLRIGDLPHVGGHAVLSAVVAVDADATAEPTGEQLRHLRGDLTQSEDGHEVGDLRAIGLALAVTRRDRDVSIAVDTTRKVWKKALIVHTGNYTQLQQLGAMWASGKADRKGGDWTHWPADLRVREYPRVAEAVTR